MTRYKFSVFSYEKVSRYNMRTGNVNAYNLSKWLPEDHTARFIIDIIDRPGYLKTDCKYI